MKFLKKMLILFYLLSLIMAGCQTEDDDNEDANSNNIVTPVARAAHSMAFAGGNKVVMFGGGGESTSDKTFEYDTESQVWREYNPNIKPSHRYAHCMIDIGDSKVIIFGGYDWDNYLNDIWEYDSDTHTWKEIIVTGITKPNGRYEHSIAFINNKIIIFGGSYFDSEDSEIFLGDTWEFDINTYTWTQFNTNGEKPSARKAHNMTAIDNDRIILFGGHDVSLVLNDTW